LIRHPSVRSFPASTAARASPLAAIASASRGHRPAAEARSCHVRIARAQGLAQSASSPIPTRSVAFATPLARLERYVESIPESFRTAANRGCSRTRQPTELTGSSHRVIGTIESVADHRWFRSFIYSSWTAFMQHWPSAARVWHWASAVFDFVRSARMRVGCGSATSASTSS
jgi:hypothetical protein